ncbi:hypothetical protein R3W88_025409 [Solanum pinnatisectum]|uniref:F-box associated beta-propeller type 1 domain-containing protein n=1 Tax=Solanum pinnatisectum TaxID=50273 RepID=A0AAV9M3L4_9SOLN|nr:hypothetical protein R3W88_025409 [Solanum pinnatisectum]
MKRPQQGISIVGSVNGLICVAIGDGDLFIWNPSIRKFKNLPDSRLKLEVSEGYDGSPCDVIYGFGYDKSSDDYKVVGVLCVEKNYDFHHNDVKIYCLKSDSWRNKDDVPDGVELMEPCEFLDGKLHWRTIISMDLADEKWGTLEQPLYTGGNFFVWLQVVGSDLSMSYYYMRSQADVWVMREYGVKESWTKTYTVKYPDNVYAPFISQKLCMSNKGEMLLVSGSTLMAHNPEDEPIKYPNVTPCGHCVGVNLYVESLVCPFLLNEQSTEQE